MKPTLALVFSFFLTVLGYAQDKQPVELGIGFVSPTNPYQYEAFTTTPEFFDDAELTQWMENGIVFPFFLKPDYGLYDFICVEKTETYFKVLINDSTYAYLPNNKDYYFRTWEVMLNGAMVQRITDDNPIHKEWPTNSEVLQYDCEIEFMKVKSIIELEGEYWIEVEFSPDCDEDLYDTPSEHQGGWIKWRTEDRLLLDILLLC